jgi:hypothetical protein
MCIVENNSYHKVPVPGHRLDCNQDFVGAKTSIVQVSFKCPCPSSYSLIHHQGLSDREKTRSLRICFPRTTSGFNWESSQSRVLGAAAERSLVAGCRWLASKDRKRHREASNTHTGGCLVTVFQDYKTVSGYFCLLFIQICFYFSSCVTL